MNSSLPFLSRILSVFAIITLAVGAVQAQVTLQVGGGAGLALPASDYAGTTIEYYNGTKYGLASGLNVHAKARVGVLGFRLTGEVDYSTFSNDGEAQPGQGAVEISQKVFAFKVGPEFYIGLPAVPVTPYIGANVALNRFSGQAKFQGVAKLPSATYDLKSATRIGVGFTGGVILKFGVLTSLDLGVSYDLLNTSGKAWEDDNPTQDQRIDSYLTLNDDKDPLYKAGDDKHIIGNARTINAVQIKATIMFGL
jgi:hypothetical protein